MFALEEVVAVRVSDAAVLGVRVRDAVVYALEACFVCDFVVSV